MNELYDLKEMLMRELEKYGSKEMTAGTLDVVDKLTHTIKNLCKILEDMDGSSNSYGYMRNYPMNSNRRRDAMGRYTRYSGTDDLVAELRDLMREAPDDKTRKEFEHFIHRMEQM